MNYLAHLYLSDPNPLAWAGSLMGDFFKGRDFSGLPEELVRHLRLHRHVDSFTRSSEPFQNSRRLMHPRFSHARSVLVDVFYDHLLACEWEEYSPTPLVDFSREVYRGLQSCHPFLSPELQQQLPRMIKYDWLASYRRPEVVGRVLLRLEERLGQKIPLAEGYGELGRWREELIQDFSAFMTEVRALTFEWKLKN